MHGSHVYCTLAGAKCAIYESIARRQPFEPLTQYATTMVMVQWQGFHALAKEYSLFLQWGYV